MSENTVTKTEISRIMDQSDLSLGAGHIALGYLLELRESKDERMNLAVLHESALDKLIPGPDYDSYIRMHSEAFDYLKKHAQELKIKVD